MNYQSKKTTEFENNMYLNSFTSNEKSTKISENNLDRFQNTSRWPNFPRESISVSQSNNTSNSESSLQVPSSMDFNPERSYQTIDKEYTPTEVKDLYGVHVTRTTLQQLKEDITQEVLISLDKQITASNARMRLDTMETLREVVDSSNWEVKSRVEKIEKKLEIDKNLTTNRDRYSPQDQKKKFSSDMDIGINQNDFENMSSEMKKLQT
ncbi:hypothetical protein HK096_000802, partial [Nowakowskiella sp. JEL0078]